MTNLRAIIHELYEFSPIKEQLYRAVLKSIIQLN